MSIADIIDNEKELTESSKKNYKSKTKKLFSLFKKEGDEYDAKFLCRKDLPELINEKWSNNHTRNGYLGAVVAVLKRIPECKERYEELSKRSTKDYNNTREKTGDNEMSDKLRDKWIDWEELVKLPVNDLTKKERLLFYLYTRIPPRRLEFRSLKYGKRLNSENWVYKPRGKPMMLHLGDYKTSKSLGPYIIEMDKTLEKAVRDLVTSEELHSGDYLFGKTKKTQMSQSSFSNFVKRVMKKVSGKPLTVVDLRKIRVSAIPIDISFNERKELARSMGHSVTKQLESYNMRPSLDEPPVDAENQDDEPDDSDLIFED